ncbi:MAG: histidinol-phosphate transaminase [Proteobacteria bacterium]|nr:histidinol-phosphate transaminase [Pseudomonadota bacterium]
MLLSTTNFQPEPKPPSDEQIKLFIKEEVRQGKGYALDQMSRCLKLDQNEHYYEWPKAIKQLISSQLLQSSWKRYPTPYPVELEELMCSKLSLAPGSVMFGPGSSTIIDLLFATLCHNVPWVILAPSFVLYDVRARLHQVTYSPWYLEDHGDFTLDSLPTLHPGSVVLFASPNNPTGSLLPYDTLKHLLKTYPQTLFICDGAYEEFSQLSYQPLLHEFSNLLILKTFAKAYSAAGIRLGYMLGASQFLRELRKYQLPFSINNFTLIALQTILNHPTFFQDAKEHIKLTIRQREFLFSEMSAYQREGFYVMPSHANFLLMRWDDTQQCNRFYQRLKADNILIRNLSGYGQMKGALRVTLGTPSENQIFLDAFKKWIHTP